MDVLRSKILRDLKRLTNDGMMMDIIKEVDDDESVNCKTPQNADKLRDKASKILAKGDLDDNKQRHKALSLLNESIARAPITSEEMAKTYAVKCALLFDMRKYNESLSEAEKALKITNLIFLKVKLLCRKAECLTALGSSENRSCLEKARFVLNKSEDPSMIKDTLAKFIENAESVVNEGKLDIPKENKRMAEVSKIIADVESKDIWESVEIKHNKKYGRHVVAARDFEPGEIVLVERSYLYYLRESRVYQYCGKCFNYLWTVVPCDQCCWRLYCSEECKNEAWEEFHDLECSVLSKIKFALCCQWNEIIRTLLTTFFKALKKAGSIDQLLADFKSSLGGDQCDKDLDHKTIFASSTIDVREADLSKIRQQESLPLFTSDNTLKVFLAPTVSTDRAAITLVALAKFTTIFKKTYNFNEIRKLMKDEKAISVGCLLLKLSSASITGGVSIKLIDPSVTDGSYQEKLKEAEKGEDPTCRSMIFSIMNLLTLEGCIPNIDMNRTVGHKSLFWALQPIKAGTPLTLYNQSPSIYEDTPKYERQLRHQRKYNCPCDCQACTEDWSEDLSKSKQVLRQPIDSDFEDLIRFMTECGSLMNEMSSHITVHKPNWPDLKSMSRVHSCARDMWKFSHLPYALRKMCTDMLRCFTFQFHNPNKNLFTTS